MIEKVDNDLKQALKDQDKFKLSVLRMLKSDFVNESRKGTLHELTDDDAMKVVKHQVKVRKDSIKEYTEYGKTDVVETLQKEIDILNEYLPEELSEDEINKIIDEVFAEMKPESIKDMGKVMKAVASKITNADMSFVSKLIKDRLS